MAMFRGKFIASAVAFAAAVSATAACAMSAPPHDRQSHCTVVGAEKLPAEVGGPDALCSALARAVAAKAPGLRYTAELHVPSPSVLIAKLVVNGRNLQEQRFGVMDRDLNPASVERFAQSLATLLAEASKD